ncbi:MAG: hypothetical protein QM487_11620 [Candidatus Marithrix sp.]
MNKLQLLIETPRAGKWNHRFIVADDNSLSESKITKFIATARRNLQGDDYIAVSSETAQSISGRKGKEILVLVGIDIKQLSDVECQKIEQKLACIDIETFITETIDWNRDGKELLVRRPELIEWEKDFNIWSKFSYSEKKSLLSKLTSNKLKLIAGVVGILVVLGIGFLITSSEKTKIKNIDSSENQPANDTLGTPSTVTEETTAPFNNEDLKKQITELLNNVDCDDKELFNNTSTQANKLIDICEDLQSNSDNIQKSWKSFKDGIKNSNTIDTIDKSLNHYLKSEKPLYTAINLYLTTIKKEK